MNSRSAIDSFKDFLADKLANGDLMEEWDESLQGKGLDYELDEADITEVSALCYRLETAIYKA